MHTSCSGKVPLERYFEYNIESQILIHFGSATEETLLGEFGPEDDGNTALQNVAKYNSQRLVTYQKTCICMVMNLLVAQIAVTVILAEARLAPIGGP